MPDHKERCLFIGPRFFGYEVDIADAIRGLGIPVDYVDERPRNSSLVRAAARINPRIIKNMVRKYYAQQLKRVGEISYSHVFVLKGEIVLPSFLHELRNRNRDAKFIFYTFDSISKSPNFLNIRHLFDSMFSFDYIDCEADPELEILPLFYSKQFYMRGETESPKTELAFVGTLHSGRYAATESLFGHFSSVLAYYYCPAIWFYLISRFVTREYADIPISDVSFQKLSRNRVAEIFRDSRGVVDIQRRGQSGLTMRTFEVLASGSALITTNIHINRLPRNLSDRALYVNDLSDVKSASLISDFLSSIHELPVDRDVLSDFSVDAWARRLFRRSKTDKSVFPTAADSSSSSCLSAPPKMAIE